MADAPLMNQVLHGVLMSAGSAALGGVLYLLSQGAQYVSTRIKNDRLREAWGLASDYAQRVVREVASSYVEPTKAAGNWTEASAAKAKQMATTQLKNMLVAQSDAKVLTLPATTGAANLDTLAATFVESAVHDLKAQAAVVAGQAAQAAAPVVTLVQHGVEAARTEASAEAPPNVSRETLPSDAPGGAGVPPIPAPVAP